jgi:PKD repeat protein
MTLILILGAASGCLDFIGGGSESTDPEPTDSTGGNQTTSGPNGGNNTTSPAANTPPTANVTASPHNGSAPLNVTFELAGADADGDALNWTLDLGDGNQTNGTELPATYEHSYNASGNFTATLTVSDGATAATDSVNVTVEASEEAAATREDAWVVFNPDGTCDAKEAVGAGPLWWHDRPGEGEPYGSGFVTGGGTWVYEESNDIDGLQVGHADEDAAYRDCVNPDTLIF